MPFNRPTLAEIRERTRADARSRFGLGALLPRSVLGILADVLAGAAHTLFGYLAWISRQVMPDTAETEHLDRWGTIWGVTRTEAVFATGTVTFTGLAGSTIPAGTKVRRADGVEFSVDALATFTTSTVQANVTAVLAGADANTDAGASVTLVSPVSGVETGAEVTTEITGGADIESDADLRARLLKRIQDPPHGGSAADYEQWALSIADVTRAWVLPGYEGIGSVGVTFVVDNDPVTLIPDGAKVTEVQDYIDTVRPVTARVTVFAPTGVDLDPDITLTPDTAEVRAAVEAALEDLLTREAEPGGTLLLSHIKEAISTAAGETDHTLNSPSADVTHATGEIPVLGTITWA